MCRGGVARYNDGNIQNTMQRTLPVWLPWALLLALLTAISLAVRDYMPIDETRYVSVAWEMWQRGDFLVPFKNGAAYSHKPPLLFWLYQAGWWVFGVNDWWPRLVSPLLSLGGLILTTLIARRLWPESDAQRRVSAILLACTLWALFSVAAMFDIMMAFCTLLGLHGLVRATHNERSGWWQYALAIGLGVLAKGPAILLHLLPVALFAPWWLKTAPSTWGRWYRNVGLSVLAGAALALAWAVPAALHGGDAYTRAIFWGQTANRMAESFAHKRPIWWYVPVLPLLLFPWLVWPPLWRGLRALAVGSDVGVRFALAWMVPAFVAFSLVSGKQPHYLMPEVPAFALLAARALDFVPGRASRAWLPGALLMLVGIGFARMPQSEFTAIYLSAEPMPHWPGFALAALGATLLALRATPAAQTTRLALVSLFAIVLLHLGPIRVLAPAYDMRPFAREIAKVQIAGRPVAHIETYDAQFQFAGRLHQGLEVIDRGQVKTWIAAHPNGALVAYVERGALPPDARPLARQPYFKLEAVLLDATEASRLMAQPVELKGS